MILDHLLSDVIGPEHSISARYFPGACGSLTGLRDNFFLKKPQQTKTPREKNTKEKNPRKKECNK